MSGQCVQADQDEGHDRHSHGNDWIPHGTEQDQEGCTDGDYSLGLRVHGPDDMAWGVRGSEPKDLL